MGSIGLTVNLRNVAISQYQNFEFNSLAEIDGHMYGASADGIFLLEGDDDDGTLIDAVVELVKTGFGAAGQKRLLKGYIGYESAGDLTIQTTYDDGTQITTTIPSVENGLEQNGSRFPGNRSGKGRYMAFRVENVSGCDFSLDHIELFVTFLSRKPSGVA